jgi:PAS domain S-box-containing protein
MNKKNKPKDKATSKAKSKLKSNSLAALRKKAEKRLSEQSTRLDGLSKKDVKHLVNELGTHQIELEMQNEELRRARVELEASRAKYADLYEFSPVGYFTFDMKGLIQEVNLTGANMLGMEKRFLLSKPIRGFVDPAHRANFRNYLLEVFRTQTLQTCDLTFLGRDGRVFHAQLHSLSFKMGEEDPGVCRTAVSDVTERKRAEDELKTAHAALVHRAYDLQAVNAQLESFSYAVSHDLKAPLRTIEGFTRALLEEHADGLDAKGRDYLRRVHSASGRMNQLIDAMLSMARLTHAELQENTVDLAALVRIAGDVLRKQNPERQVEFVIADTIKVKGDKTMLQAVIENLLNNAWKFTSRHAAAKIEFGSTEMDGKTIYYVRDDGAGFDMHYAEKLFQPFSRLHTESEFPGLGIGLATVLRIIQRHGGRIWAEGATDQGATFYFTL